MNDEIILTKFSERLFKLVKEHNTDVSILAKAMGIKSKSTIYRYMNAEMSPKISTVKYLAEYYNVSPAWLMGYDVPMERSVTPTAEVGDGRTKEYIELFELLTEDEKALIIHAIKGLLSER